MRVTNPEIEERTDEVTLIEAKGPRGQKFILVDGGKELQPSGADAPGALEGGGTSEQRQTVVRHCFGRLEKIKREQTQKEEISFADNLGASDSEGEDAVMNLLLKAQGSRAERLSVSRQRKRTTNPRR